MKFEAIFRQICRGLFEEKCIFWVTDFGTSHFFSRHPVQKVALKVILGQSYTTYEDALTETSLKTLKIRRQEKSLKYACKALKHPLGQQMFPLNNNENPQNTRKSEKFHVNFAHTEVYKKSTIPSLQRFLNQHHAN